MRILDAARLPRPRDLGERYAQLVDAQLDEALADEALAPAIKARRELRRWLGEQRLLRHEAHFAQVRTSPHADLDPVRRLGILGVPKVLEYSFGFTGRPLFLCAKSSTTLFLVPSF